MTEPTDAEIESAWVEATGSSILPYPDDMRAFARAVLAKWGTLRTEKIVIPTDTMEQEFQKHYQRGYAAGQKASATQPTQAQAIQGVQWQCGPQASGFTAPQADSQPAPTITDEAIDRIAESMSGGLDGFLKGWGWRQFARAVIDADRAMRAAQPAGAQQPAPSAAAALSDDLRDRLVAISGAIADQDDRAAQAMLREILKAPQPTHTPQAGSQPAPVLDMAVMQLAESVGLIGPASRTHDLHAAVQRFHDLICVNATIKAAVMAADAIRGAATSARDYPPLPMQFACSGVFPVYSADQMRAYVDADRAARAPADSVTAPVGGANWQDISTAPKDGTRFVAVGNNYGLYSETQHTCIAQWFRGCWMEASDWNETSELKYLTHWMPLLPLPGSAEMRTQQTIEQQEIALLTDEELCQIEEPHLVNLRIPLGGQYDFARDVEKAVLEKTRGMQAPTPPAQADSVLEDAARLDWLLLHISGAEFRRIGVHYSGNASRADVDAARKQGENHD